MGAITRIGWCDATFNPVGRMSARLDRLRPLLCGGALMALRVALTARGAICGT